jgi:hypothetical protein
MNDTSRLACECPEGRLTIVHVPDGLWQSPRQVRSPKPCHHEPRPVRACDVPETAGGTWGRLSACEHASRNSPLACLVGTTPSPRVSPHHQCGRHHCSPTKAMKGGGLLPVNCVICQRIIVCSLYGQTVGKTERVGVPIPATLWIRTALQSMPTGRCANRISVCLSECVA